VLLRLVSDLCQGVYLHVEWARDEGDTCGGAHSSTDFWLVLLFSCVMP
jgi:hypothetical protein